MIKEKIIEEYFETYFENNILFYYPGHYYYNGPKIPVSRRNSQGNLFIVRDINGFVSLMNNDLIIQRIKDKNTIYLIHDPCNKKMFHHISRLLKQGWQKHGILYQIVLWKMCEVSVNNSLSFLDRLINSSICLQVVIFFDKLSFDSLTRTWGQATFIHLRKLEEVSDIFTFYFQNFRGYPIRISLFVRYPTSVNEDTTNDLFLSPYLKDVEKTLKFNGIDPIILYNTFNFLNFTPVMQTDQIRCYGHRMSNGSYVGSLGRVIYNQTDISFNGRFINDYEATGLIEFLRPIAFDDICFMTPKAKKIPKLKAELFEPRALIALIIVIAVISCFWRYLQITMTQNSLKLLEPVSFVIIEFCMMLVSSSISKLPKTSVQRMIVAGLLLAGCYFSEIFHAALSTAMSTVTHEKDINTFKQLAESGLPIVCSSR